MAALDQAQLDQLERREVQLSVLASVIMLTMAVGVALLMYPLVFLHPEEGNKWSLRFGFFGFCALSVLFVIYLVGHQRTVRKLKQQIVEEWQRHIELQQQANSDLLQTIPNVNHFRDRVVMEYRRAQAMERSLSLLAVKFKLAAELATEEEKLATLGEAAKIMAHAIRPTDSMYLFAPGAFSIVMPDTGTAEGKVIQTKLETALRTTSLGKYTFETTFCNYPATARSAHELEQAMSMALLDNQMWMESVTAR
jgi:GGDEF domain-containing protein